MARAARPDMYRSAGLALVPVHPGSLVLFGRDVVLPARPQGAVCTEELAVQRQCGCTAALQPVPSLLHTPGCTCRLAFDQRMSSLLSRMIAVCLF